MFGSGDEVGLDIGDHRIKVVQVKKSGRKFRVTVYGTIDTPPGTIENGFIVDPPALGRELGILIRDIKLARARTVASVSGQQVYTRLMAMPYMRLKELRQAALFQASTFLPISIDEVTSDILPLRYFEDDEGKKIELFFIAVRKTETDNLFSCCEEAGIRLTAVEVGALALARTYKHHFDEKPGQALAIFDIGANRSSIAVYNNNILNFLRFIPFGCAQFLRGADFNNGPHLSLEDIRIDEPRYDYLINDLASELRRSIDYYEMQNSDRNLSLLLICGGGSRIKGIGDKLAAQLHYPVKLGQLGADLILPGNKDEQGLKSFQHDFPTAIGLALRGVR